MIIFVHRRIGWILVAALTLALGWLLFWYLQSPVPARVYPGRVGGRYWDDSASVHGAYRLPVVWIRPHPFAEFPPALEEGALTGPSGEGGISRGARADLKWHQDSRPIWLRPRSVEGYLSLPFPADGFTANGVRFRWEGQQDRRYSIGEIALRLIPRGEGGPLSWGSSYHYDQAGGNPQLVASHLHVEGWGTLTALTPGAAGMTEVAEGARYWQGAAYAYPNAPGGEPLRLPLQLAGRRTVLYLPLTEPARELLKQTHFSGQYLLRIESPTGVADAVIGTDTLRPSIDSRWRRDWVDYYIYKETQ